MLVAHIARAMLRKRHLLAGAALWALGACGSTGSSGEVDAALDVADAGVAPVPDAAPGWVCPGDGGFARYPDAGTAADARPPRDAGASAAQCSPDPEDRITVMAGRLLHCAIDVGSKNVRMSVTSMSPGQTSSLAEERACKTQKNLGDRTYDQKTEMGRPLPMKDLDELVKLLGEYKAICARDGATLVGAVATEWARRATNQDEIKTALRERLQIELDILSGEREGQYGYIAGTRGQLNKVIVDSGSRSAQLSYWHEKDPDVKVVSVPLGSDEASDRFFASPMYASYAEAHAAYLAYLRSLVKDGLAPVRDYLRAGKLDPFLLSLGDSGLQLAVDGSLIDPCNGRWVDPDVYEQKLVERRGPGRSRSLQAEQVKEFLAALSRNDEWFRELRSDRLKKAYGNKVMAALALMAYLLEEIGLEELWFVSAEMAEGVIVEKVKP